MPSVTKGIVEVTLPQVPRLCGDPRTVTIRFLEVKDDLIDYEEFDGRRCSRCCLRKERGELGKRYELLLGLYEAAQKVANFYAG